MKITGWQIFGILNSLYLLGNLSVNLYYNIQEYSIERTIANIWIYFSIIVLSLILHNQIKLKS